MVIKVSCQSCGSGYEMPDELGGQVGQCACGATFQIPQPLAAVAVPVSSPEASDNPYAAPAAEVVATTVSPVQHGFSALEVTQIAKCRTGLSFLYASVIILLVAFFGGLILGVSGVIQPGPATGLVLLLGLMGLSAFVCSIIGNGFLMAAPIRSTGQGLMKAAFGLQIGSLILTFFDISETFQSLGRSVLPGNTSNLSLTLLFLGMHLGYNVCWCLGMQRFFNFVNDPLSGGRASLLLKLMVTVIGLGILSPVMSMSMAALAALFGITIFVLAIITIVVYVRLIEQGRKTLRNITG